MHESKNTGYQICGRLCVELSGHLASPLSIGSGEQEETDADVILDAKGVPFIPGSAIAGVLRAYNHELGLEEKSNQLFGAPYDGIPGSESDIQSRIFCYDAVLKDARMSIRDGVKLGQNKTPESGAKYEIQIIERNAGFRMRFEMIQRKNLLDDKSIQKVWEEDKSWILQWVHGFRTGELRIGARSSRGFGKLAIDSVKIKGFHMEQDTAYWEWLDWDWDNEDAFENAETIEVGSCLTKKEYQHTEHCLKVPLKIPYTLLVRSYNAGSVRDKGIPDYRQLTVDNQGKRAVIPGSSIAGAFRSHIAKIMKQLSHLQSWEEAQKKLEPFFGTWTEGEWQEENLLASKVIFEEAVVKGGDGVPLTRIAIDRFTGGTIEGALLEEVPWAGGEVLLCIRWKKGKEEESNKLNRNHVICGMLIWAILDLLSGILAIGGETAIGRGIFCSSSQKGSEITLDGKVLQESQKEQYMKAAALWCKGRE